ncbi:MAG: TM2 domain-containing protein [Pseudomonadota bacterium]
MSRPWQKLDLSGGGLQSVNQKLAGRLRKRTTTWALWPLFPLGLHRLYLGDRRGAAALPLLTLGALVLWWAGWPPIAAALATVVLGWGVVDLFRIEGLRAEVNKTLRKQAFLGGGATPPAGYRGRYPQEAEDPEAAIAAYSAEKEQEHGGHMPPRTGGDDSGSRMPSFNEQEKMLREMAQERAKDGRTRDESD